MASLTDSVTFALRAARRDLHRSLSCGQSHCALSGSLTCRWLLTCVGVFSVTLGGRFSTVLLPWWLRQ